MVIKSMDHFQNVCKNKFVEWYNKSSYANKGPNDIQKIDTDDVFVVWVCKTLQNYKYIIGTRAAAILAEYTYNGNDGVLYEGIYKKIVNASHLVE